MNVPDFVKFLMEYLFRYEPDIPMPTISVPVQPISKSEVEFPYDRYISDLETINDSLNERVQQLEKEKKCLQDACKQKDQRIHDMEIRIDVLKTMFPRINIIHTDRAGQVNGIVESGAHVTHTIKDEDYDT